MIKFLKASIFYATLLAVTSFAGHVSAQTETTASDTVLPSTAVLVSNVNIYDAKVVSQEDNKVLIGFDIKNEGGTVNGDVVESGLKYGIKVIDGKTTNENGITIYGATIDERVFSDTLSLNTGEKVHKEIVYTAPHSFNGEYYIQVYGVKEGGLPYALAYIQEPVSFEASTDVFSINITDCVMVVGSEEQEYSMEQGVDVASTEELSLKCTLDASGKLGNYTPQITIYERALSGDVVSDVKLESRTVESNTTNDVLFVIPVPSAPQAYDAKLILLSGSDEEAETISNAVAGHFVVQGDSATIHDVQLDKDYYAAGEQAEVVLSVSGNAGAFLDSRASLTNPSATEGNGGYWYKVAIVSGDRVCGDTGDLKEFVFNEYGSQVIPVTITADCINPKTNVTLSSKDGKVYDEQSFAVVSKNVPPEAVIAVTPDNTSTINILLVLTILIILGYVGYFMYERLKKTPDDTTIPPASNIVGLLVAMLVSSMFFGASTADAAVYNIRTTDIDVAGVSTPQYSVLVLNNSKEFYAPTDTEITVNYSGTVKSCGNFLLGFALFGGHVAYTANYGTPIFETGGIVTASEMEKNFTGVAFTRPMTTNNPGTGNVVSLTGANYIIHDGDGTGVCDGSHGCTNVCNNQCDKNTSWVSKSTGYDENTCTCYNVETFGNKVPTNINHPYGIATPVDFTLVTTPVAGCAGGASTNVSFGAVVGANTYEIDCGAGFVAGQTATCNLVASGNHTITARASHDSEPWLTKTATVVVPDCTTAVSGMCGSLAGRVGDWDALSSVTNEDKCESGTYNLLHTDLNGKLGFYEWSCDGISPGTNASCWFEQRVTTNPLLKFTALPYSVERNDKIYLTWETQNATVCTATGGVAGDGWAGDKAVNGSQEIVMTSTGYPHYYLQCWNSAGVATPKIDRGITVLSATYATINGISSLEALPSTINFGESSTIVWTTVGDVKRCETGGGSWVAGIDLPINGSQVVTPSGAVSGYRIKCYNEAGTLRGDHTTTVIMENIPDGGLVATCPYTDTPDSIIINFNSGLSRDDLSVRVLKSDVTSFTQNAFIPSRTYDIETTSYDGYAGRHSTTPQGDERWHFVFQTAGGGTVTTISTDTTDIADGVDQNHRYDSYSGKALGSNIAKVKVIHSATNVAHSVVPVCMKLSPVGTAPMLNLEATPQYDVPSGNPVILKWTPTNANKCVAYGGNLTDDNWNGDTWDHTGGTFTVHPTTNTSYSMECWDNATPPNSSGVRTVNVTVTGSTAPDLTFSASPGSITGVGVDTISTLTWTPVNVDKCTAYAIPGSLEWSGDVPHAGVQTKQVTPGITTDYFLECEDTVSGVKTGEKKATVTVVGAPAGLTVDVIANPSPAIVNQVIRWSATPHNGTGPYTYSWTGDAGVKNGTDPWIEGSFGAPTTANVSVTVTDTSTGDTAPGSKSVNINSVPIKPQ